MLILKASTHGFHMQSIIDETGLDILQLQNTTSSDQVKLPKKYVRKSTLKFYYENLINNTLSKLDTTY